MRSLEARVRLLEAGRNREPIVIQLWPSELADGDDAEKLEAAQLECALTGRALLIVDLRHVRQMTPEEIEAARAQTLANGEEEAGVG